MDTKMEEGLVVKGRVEIDTRQPFKSVKEAVLLFGEKVLAGEIYAHKLKEIEKENNQHGKSIIHEEKKQTLESSNDEEKLMTYYLLSLKQQLEETKSELNQLKITRGPYSSHNMSIDPEVEEIKLMEDPKPVRVKPPMEDKYYKPEDDSFFEPKEDDSDKFQTPQAKVIVQVPKMQERSPSSFKIKKAKKKTLIPLLSGIFSKTKG